MIPSKATHYVRTPKGTITWLFKGSRSWYALTNNTWLKNQNAKWQKIPKPIEPMVRIHGS